MVAVVGLVGGPEQAFSNINTRILGSRYTTRGVRPVGFGGKCAAGFQCFRVRQS